MSLTVLVDRLAFDVLEDQVGLPVLAHTGVEEPGDGRMGQSSEEVRLMPDLHGRQFIQSLTFKKLDGDLAFEFIIAATCQPDTSHSAPSQQPLYRVRTDLLADKRVVGR